MIISYGEDGEPVSVEFLNASVRDLTLPGEISVHHPSWEILVLWRLWNNPVNQTAPYKPGDNPLAHANGWYGCSASMGHALPHPPVCPRFVTKRPAPKNSSITAGAFATRSISVNTGTKWSRCPSTNNRMSSSTIDRQGWQQGRQATDNQLGWQVIGKRSFRIEEFHEAIADLKAAKWNTFTDNFLPVVLPSGYAAQLNWFDDHRWRTRREQFRGSGADRGSRRRERVDYRS